MSHFNEAKLREFLLALMASDTRPSPTLVKALTKYSGLDPETVEDIFNEVFRAPETGAPAARPHIHQD